MNVKCPNCNIECVVADNLFGHFITCQSCGKGFVVGTTSTSRTVDKNTNTTIDNQATDNITPSAVIAQDNSKVVEAETPTDIYFEQPCPSCGKMLAIRENVLFHSIACTRCGKMLLCRENSLIVLPTRVVVNPRVNREKALFNLAILRRKLIPDACPNCGTGYAVCGTSHGTDLCKCEKCGALFCIGDGYKLLQDRVNTKLVSTKQKLKKLKSQYKQGKAVRDVYNYFQLESDKFESDWALYKDPTTEERIRLVMGRIQIEINRLQTAKLGSLQVQSMGAQMLYSNTIGLRDPQSVLGGISRTLTQLSGALTKFSAEDECGRIEDAEGYLLTQYEQCAQALNQLFDLRQEFDGKTKESARAARLYDMTGYSNESELPSENDLLSGNSMLNLSNNIKKLEGEVSQTKRESKRLIEEAKSDIFSTGRTIAISIVSALLVLGLLVYVFKS